MKSSCLNARALILSLQPCSGQNDSGMTNLSFRAGNEWAGVLLFPYRKVNEMPVEKGIKKCELRKVIEMPVEK